MVNKDQHPLSSALINIQYQHPLSSTRIINTPHYQQHALYIINTPYKHTLSTPFVINTPYQHVPLINTPCHQHPISTPLINNNPIINTPYQHITYQHPLSSTHLSAPLINTQCKQTFSTEADLSPLLCQPINKKLNL